MSFEPQPCPADSVAFLQYTSGSTSDSKGVMVTHGNLTANEEMIRRGFGHDQDSTVVGWAPFFHDQGLIGNVLQPLWCGKTSILMSPPGGRNVTPDLDAAPVHRDVRTIRLPREGVLPVLRPGRGDAGRDREREGPWPADRRGGCRRARARALRRGAGRRRQDARRVWTHPAGAAAPDRGPENRTPPRHERDRRDLGVGTEHRDGLLEASGRDGRRARTGASPVAPTCAPATSAS